MNKFFYPAGIAVFGVSDSENNLARNIVENLLTFSFKGEVYPVGRKGGFIGAKKIYKKLQDVPQTPDLAVLLIPAHMIPQTLNECAKYGIRRAVIEAGGFSEFSSKGSEAERVILEIVQSNQMKVIGPNCVGTVNVENGVVLPFYPVEAGAVKKGSASLISQSGALLQDTIRKASAENLGLNKLISVGNKLQLDENDFLEYLISDPGTDTIGLYLEGIKNGRRLMDLAYSTDKPIIIVKANRTQAGREIAQFHTAALAGDDEVTDAAFRQCGIHRARNLAEMLDLFKIFTLPRIKGTKLFLIVRSGGQGVVVADAAECHGFRLAELPAEFYDRVGKKVRAGVINRTNPLDLGDLYEVEFYVEIIRKALEQEAVDGIVFAHDYYLFDKDIALTLSLISESAKLSRVYGKPVVFYTVPDKKRWFTLKEANDFPLFSDADSALKAIAASLDHARFQSVRFRQHHVPVDRGPIRSSSSLSRLLDVREAFDLFTSGGLPLPDYEIANSREEALAAAVRIGYPVALKIALPQVLHKTEKNGVRLDLTDEPSLMKACEEMEAEAYLIQKMTPRGHEVFIGAKRDADFGHVLLFGLGGIFVEVFRDIATRIVPVDEEMAREMVDEIQGSVILKGFRGAPCADLQALYRCLVAVSDLLMQNPDIVNIDINPLIVFEQNHGCMAVDAKIERDV